MTSATLLLFFVFGTIIGSFLNVVLFRYGTKKLSGRSFCFFCGKTLKWRELIPIFSFAIQKGRCRGCKGKISIQYPIVEISTGLIFTLIVWSNLPVFETDFSLTDIAIMGLELIFWSLLIAISVYDARHKIIPDGLLYGSIFIALIFLFGRGLDGIWTDLFSGILFAAPFALLWFFSRGRAIGLGDAKLMVLFPWFLGIPQGLSAIILGFWIGAVISIFALLLKKISKIGIGRFPNLKIKLSKLTLKTEIPLGPFLIFGLFLVYLLGWDITGLSLSQ